MSTHAHNWIYQLTSDNLRNWQELLKFGQTLDLDEQRKFLWAWPTVASLEQLNEMLREYGIQRLLSIGCGNGLLEWLLRESGSIAVYGLEVDSRWWNSDYAVRSFVEVQYVDPTDDQLPINSEFLKSCCHTDNWNFALLFCYFNNRPAFVEYLRLYRGQWLIIIGPRPNIGVHTDPNPLQPKFPQEECDRWQLMQTLAINAENIVAVYKRH